MFAINMLIAIIGISGFVVVLSLLAYQIITGKKHPYSYFILAGVIFFLGLIFWQFIK